MVEHPDIVTLVRAPSPSAATVLLSILLAEGIPAYIAGTLLQDEFALSQRLMGLNAVEIQVPRNRLEEARKVLEAARQAGRELPE
ncbi:MAG TPA: DUF2007 domain-containing protein [Planctomycetota bacterium]|jgi:hypothetical protein|nr:DUF2007 domain-containing protein [Planctomycetota bacterium]